MEKIFESALELNPNFTDESLKQIAYDTFEEIFTYLGKEKFIRWINKEELAENIKKLVIELFTQEDEKEYPNWGGFYTMSTNRIKLRSNQKKLDVNIHETYHFITDYRKRFTTFINEGLTEYLNLKTQNKTTYTYVQNVNFVSFLHEMVGDSLIKAYLMGVDEDFEKKLSTYISADGKEDLSVYRNFERMLNEIHTVLHPRDDDDIILGKDVTEEEREDHKKTLFLEHKEIIKNIIVNSFAKKVNNLEFYTNGNIDFRAMRDEIIEMIKVSRKALIAYDFKDVDFDNEIGKRCLEVFLEGTHILFGEEDKERKKSEIISKVFEKSEMTGPNSKKFFNINVFALEEEYRDTYDSLPFKLAKMRLEKNEELLNEGKFDISKFLTQIALIKSKTNVSDLELDTIISNYLLENFSKDIDIKSVHEAIKNTVLIQDALNTIQVQREKDTVESKFIKVSDDGYIEKRDNQFWYIEIDREKGSIMQSRFPNFVNCRPVGRNAFKEKDLSVFDSRIIAGSIKTKKGTIQVALDDNFENFVIQSKGEIKKSCTRLESIDDLKNYIFSQELIKDLKEKAHNREYTTILSDAEKPYYVEGILYLADTDSRSRKIDINSFMQDMKNVLKAIPNNLQSDIVDELVEELIQSTYSLELSKYKEQMDILKEQIKVNMVSVNEQDKGNSLNIINGILDQFNEMRRNQTLENTKNNCVMFLTPEAKQRYTLNERYKRQRENLAAKNSFIKSVNKYITSKEDLYNSSGDFYDSYITENMLGLFQTVSCPSCFAVDVDILEFAQELRGLLQEVPKKERTEYFHEITSKSLKKWFGSEGRNYERERKGYKTKRMELYEQISQKLEEYVLTETQPESMDLEFFKTRFEQINDISRSEAEISKKTSFILFEDKETANTYESINILVRNPDIPDESKKMVIKTLVKNNNERIIQKRKMRDLLKNSLQNGNIATRSSVASAERVYSRAQEQEVQKINE